MKTKYIKVAVSERKPHKEGWYIVERHNTNAVSSYYYGKQQTFSNGDAKFWLEEVPDIEQEMKEMLEKARDKFLDLKYDKDLPELEEIQCEIEELLNSIKQ